MIAQMFWHIEIFKDQLSYMQLLAEGKLRLGSHYCLLIYSFSFSICHSAPSYSCFLANII